MTAGTITAKSAAMILGPHAEMIVRMTGKTSAEIVVGLVLGLIGASGAVHAPGLPGQTTGGIEAGPVAVTLATAVAHLVLEPNGVIGLAPGYGSAAEIGAAPHPEIAIFVTGGIAVVPVPVLTRGIAAAIVLRVKRRSARRTIPRRNQRTTIRSDGLGVVPDRPQAQVGRPRA